MTRIAGGVYKLAALSRVVDMLQSSCKQSVPDVIKHDITEPDLDPVD